MSKTTRRNWMDDEYGCFEGYFERRGRSCCRINCEEDYARDYAYEKDLWDKRARDKSRGSKRGGRSLYRRLTNRLIREETRRMIHRGIKTNDWDNLAFPTDWDGKQFIWDVW